MLVDSDMSNREAHQRRGSRVAGLTHPIRLAFLVHSFIVLAGLVWDAIRGSILIHSIGVATLHHWDTLGAGDLQCLMCRA